MLKQLILIAAIVGTQTVTRSANTNEDGWFLKMPYEANSKHAWNMSVLAEGGPYKELTLRQRVSFASGPAGELKGTAGWDQLVIDGRKLDIDIFQSWEVDMSENGRIVATGENPVFARMLAPITFVYPNAKIKTGDTWTAKCGPKSTGAGTPPDMTTVYKVLGQEQIGGVLCKKIQGILSETGGMKADTTFWIASSGKVLRFAAKVQQWALPIGGRERNMNVTINGEMAAGQ